MKLAVCVLICTMLLLSIPVMAGPMTGAPTISYGDSSMGLTTRTGTIGLGYSTFEFRADGQSATASGPIISGEYNIPMGEAGDKLLSVGAWLANVSGDGEDANLGDLHARYSFSKSWGFELGIPLADTSDVIGGIMYHAVYQPKPSTDGKISTQFGIGKAASATNEEWDYRINTDLSAFANASYAITDTMSASLSMWYLKQSLHLGFDDSNLGVSTVKWSLAASYKF